MFPVVRETQPLSGLFSLTEISHWAATGRKCVEQSARISNDFDGVIGRQQRRVIRLPGANGRFDQFHRDPIRRPGRNGGGITAFRLCTIVLSIAAGHEGNPPERPRGLIKARKDSRPRRAETIGCVERMLIGTLHFPAASLRFPFRRLLRRGAVTGKYCLEG